MEASEGRPSTLRTSSHLKIRGSPLQKQHWNPTYSSLEVGKDGRSLFILTSDGRGTRILAKWLRDVCSCPECRNPETKQRRVNVFRASAEATKVVKVTRQLLPERISVEFADGHKTVVDANILHARGSMEDAAQREGIVPVRTWGQEIAEAPPEVSYSRIIAGSKGMADLLMNIRTYGFCFVDEMPATPEASESLLNMIGPIRNTHYGAFYDFTSDLSSKDTAYTSEALEPHTDNIYFTEPAGLQALHLLSHTDGSGGESSLVDGFGVAEQLFFRRLDAYKLLTTTGVYGHASGNEGISIQSAKPFPTFTHGGTHAKLIQVRWNNADRAGVDIGWKDLHNWYEAAGIFDGMLNDVKNQYWFQLKPGRMLLFDNWRVLHGRAAFTGKRRMCGGYINRDDWVSRFRTLNFEKAEVERSTLTG